MATKKSSFLDLAKQAVKELGSSGSNPKKKKKNPPPEDAPMGDGLAKKGADAISGRQKSIDDAEYEAVHGKKRPQ